MPLSRLFFPCWSGDFRLEAIDNDANAARSILTVEDPTQADIAKLRPFLVEARSRAWVAPEAGIQPKGKTVIEVEASVTEAGGILSGIVHMPDLPLWLAVRQSNGETSVRDTTAVTVGGMLKGMADKVVDALTPDLTPDLAPPAAAVVKQPRTGCPPPTACERRASEVLAAFSTPRQMDEWWEHGRMRVIGNISGRTYHLHHRDEAAKRGMHHILLDVAARKTVCAWDHDLPPAEEALSLKLAVECREAWLMKGLSLQRDGRHTQKGSLFYSGAG